MPAYSQLTHALASRLDPGERALTNQDLRQIFGMVHVTAETRGEIAADLRDAGLEILSDPASEPLVVRKAAAPPAPPESRPAPAGSRRPWIIAAAALVLVLALIVALPAHDPVRAAPPVAAKPRPAGAAERGRPTRKPAARDRGRPARARSEAERTVRAVEVARARKAARELRCRRERRRVCA